MDLSKFNPWGWVTEAFGTIATVVDNVHTSDEERGKIKAEIMVIQNALHTKMLELQAEALKAQSAIILAEAQGQSWLQRNWRPILMLTIVFIIANNYIFFPYASMFTDRVKILILPDKLWNLMMIGVGGYVGGRTIEKSIGPLLDIFKK